MRQRMLWKWGLGVGPTVFLFLAAGTQLIAESSTSPPDTNLLTVLDTQQTNAPSDLSAAAAAPDTDAPASLVSPEKPLPPNIRPSSPVAEVIKLANSGLDESVMLAFVTNSTHTFNLGAEEIIYLNDLGVPGPVVTAMIQRDEALQGMFAAGAGAPPPGPAENVPPDASQLAAGGAPEQAMEPGPVEPSEAPLTPPDDGSDAMFYDSLAPYGNWVDVQGYGRCWQPTAVAVNPGWQPYFNCGHWVYSDCGWYWLSDYSWGWAPFHYGSWFRHAHLGWCWVPGRVWGPSWVSWRYNDNYCGWAPLPPGARFAAGVGLTFHGHHVRDGDDFGLRPGHYRFVAWNHFNDHQLNTRGLPWRETHRVFHTTTVATRITGDSHTVINSGLPTSRVAAATRRPIQTVALRQTTQPTFSGGRAERFESGSHTLTVYRPHPELASRTSLRGPSAGRGRSSTPSDLRPPSAAPWSAREGMTGAAREGQLRNGTHGGLVLRGAQPSAARESAPPNSLVVIGRAAASAPSAPSARSWPSATRPNFNRAETGSATATAEPRVASRPETPVQNRQRNWTGTVSSSPQPSWFGSESHRGGAAVAAPRPEPRSYQSVPRATSQVPRYAPSASPNYGSQRSYSAPAASAPARAPSFQSRPAPSAPSAAPAAPSAGARGSSGRNNR